jgi:hypothetical protein
MKLKSLLIGLLLVVPSAVNADERPAAFIPSAVMEAFVASTIAPDILDGKIERPYVTAHYCGVSPENSGGFIVVATTAALPDSAAASITCAKPLADIKAGFRPSVSGPMFILRPSIKWDNNNFLVAKTTECQGDGVPTAACTEVLAASRRYPTSNIKAEASGRSVLTTLAVEFNSTGALLHLISDPAGGNITFADFNLPLDRKSLVSFPITWLNSQIFTGQYPLRSSEGETGDFTVMDSKIESTPEGIVYKAQITQQGATDPYSLELLFSGNALTLKSIKVSPKIENCTGAGAAACMFQNTARQLVAQLAEVRLSRFIGRDFRPRFDHIPIKLTWNGKSYRFFGSVIDGRSDQDTVTLGLDWSVSSTGGK